ncbi:MAG: hypothetical protein ABR563_17725, partial [Pyrinomonadaceae bacterium]
DITNYMTTAAFALLRHAADHRQEWLQRFYAIGKEAVRPRKDGEVAAYVLPPSLNREALLNIFRRAGVEVAWTQAFKLNGKDYDLGTVVIPLAQPYGAFAKALLEPQHYPDLRNPSGQPIAPYDVTAHTLSLLMDVEAQPVFAPFKSPPPPSRPLPVPPSIANQPRQVDYRLALYKSHVPSIDEGWTRWILDNYNWTISTSPYTKGRINYTSLEDKEVRAGNLRAKYDAIVIPDQSPRAILNGYRAGSMPPELTGGLGAEGVRNLREFVEQGGTLIALNQASDFAIEQLHLPVRDITDGLPRTEYFAPGSILRTEIDTTNPIAKGMPRESIAWVEDSPVFEFDARDADRVHVIARYPYHRPPLLSGWLLGDDKVRGRAALVEVNVGKGHVYLFGFRPQYRAQSLATYPLLFNAISQASK